MSEPINNPEHTGLPGMNGGPSAYSPAELAQWMRRIGDKLQQLIRQREILLKENLKLKEEVKQLQLQHTDHSARLDHLQQQAEILKASKGDMDDAERKLLEKRLAQYIREIDRCIALLGE